MICFKIFTYFFLVVSSAFAHEACRQDVNRLCPGILFGQGRATVCLQTYHTQISKECEAYAMKMDAQRKAVKKACYPDIKAICKNVVAGNGRIFNCLTSNSFKISNACNIELKKTKLLNEM